MASTRICRCACDTTVLTSAHVVDLCTQVSGCGFSWMHRLVWALDTDASELHRLSDLFLEIPPVGLGGVGPTCTTAAGFGPTELSSSNETVSLDRHAPSNVKETGSPYLTNGDNAEGQAQLLKRYNRRLLLLWAAVNRRYEWTRSSRQLGADDRRAPARRSQRLGSFLGPRADVLAGAATERSRMLFHIKAGSGRKKRSKRPWVDDPFAVMR
jgi:hypothetical protein